jgi:hypothetical protein
VSPRPRWQVARPPLAAGPPLPAAAAPRRAWGWIEAGGLERGAELSPLLLLRARRRGRGRGWQERSGAALVGLHGLQQLSPRCRRGVLSRKASLAGGDKGWGASRRRPAPAAAGLMLRRRRWWCEVAGCCWVGLGVGAAAVLRSEFRLGLDVVVLVSN